MAENSEKMGQLSSTAIHPGSGAEHFVRTKEMKDCESLPSPQYSITLHQSSLTSLSSSSTSPDPLTAPTLGHLSEGAYETTKIIHNDLQSTAKSKCQNDTMEDQIKNINSVLTISLPTLPNNSSNPLNEKEVPISTESCLPVDCNGNGHSAMDDIPVQEKDKTYNGLNREDSIYSESDSDEDYSFDQKEFEVIIYDPSLFMPLPTQIAGHGSEGDGEKGFLKRPDGRLLKPVQAPPRGRRELDFYKKINSSKDPIDIRLRKCIPEFFGVEKVGFRNGITVTEEFIILRDITEGFSRPAIMDIKIGSRTWGPDASAKKQAQEDAKYAGTKHPFGFSILGLIVHSLKSEADENGEGCHGKKYNKSFGKNLKTEDVHTVPEIFFDVNESEDKVSECVEIMTRQIRTIYDAFESQKKYKIYGSSLLMAYDADAVRRFENGNIDRIELEKFVNVKLIDFAHVFSSEGVRDDNFLRGIANLLSLFEDFYKRTLRNPKI